MVNLTREVRIAERILWVDGISGTGKSMLFPILSSLDRVEVQRLEHIYENLCLIRYFGKIEKDAAVTLMRMYSDMAIHDNMISREVNFRPKDESSVFNTPQPLRYLRRLFLPDGPVVLERIRAERPILHIMTHQVLSVSDLAFDSFGEGFCIIEMVRHPLDVVSRWVKGSWGERYGTDPKDLTLWIDHRGQALPWWADGWEEKYLSLSPMGRIVQSVHVLTERMMSFYERLPEDRKRQVLFVPFESFAADPWPWIGKIESLLGTRRGPKTAGMLKKQRCPRVFSQADLDGLRAKYLAEIPEEEIKKLLVKLCEDYERAYGRLGVRVGSRS